jgi:hypothetical protein
MSWEESSLRPVVAESQYCTSESASELQRNHALGKSSTESFHNEFALLEIVIRILFKRHKAAGKELAQRRAKLGHVRAGF